MEEELKEKITNLIQTYEEKEMVFLTAINEAGDTVEPKTLVEKFNELKELSDAAEAVFAVTTEEEQKTRQQMVDDYLKRNPALTPEQMIGGVTNELRQAFAIRVINGDEEEAFARELFWYPELYKATAAFKESLTESK